MTRLLAVVWLVAAGEPALSPRSLAKPVDVRGDVMSGDRPARRLIYEGNAVARREDATVSCDRLVVHFLPSDEVSRLECEGSVRIEEGERVAQSSRADFDNLSGVMILTGAPRASSGVHSVEGERIRFTLGDEVMEVERARTTSGASGPHAVHIEADLLQVLGPQKRARWSGNVKAQRPPTVLTAREMVAVYSAKGDVTRLDARGDVRASDRGRWARGDTATYDNLARILVVRGNARGQDGPHAVTGSKFTFYVGTERLVVEDATTLLRPAGRSLPRDGAGP